MVWRVGRRRPFKQLAAAYVAIGIQMETTIDVPVGNGSAWYRCCSRRGVLTRRNRRYRGRLSAIIWYDVQEGPDRSNSLLLRNLRLAYICRRRLQCLLAMDGRDAVAVVDGASWIG